MSLNIKNDFLRVKEEDYNKVIAVYDMTDKMVQETMESMRQWYKMQPHLPEGYLSNDRLFRHLLAVGFSIEKAKVKIDNMLTARNIIPELLTQRDPAADWYKNMLKYFYFGFIPSRLDDMTRVLVLKYTTKDPSDINIWDALKCMVMTVDYRLSTDISVGNNLVIDFKRITLRHVAKANLSILKKFTFILQGCYGAKVKGVHYVNVPHFAEFIISMLKSVSSKKVAFRNHVHEDYESLQKVIPKTHLPSDFGGDNLSMKELAENFRKELCMQEWRDWFIQQDSVKADESKRVGVTSDMSNQLLGLQGSFRNLDVDWRTICY